MQTYRNFQKEFAASRPYEDIAIEKALAHFNKGGADPPFQVTRRPTDKNYKLLKFDAELGNGQELIRIEVKTDHRSSHTGNFFIEYFQYGKPSGISITDADYYVINDTVDYYMISVGRIHRIIQRYKELGKLRKREFPSPDGLITQGYIFKKTVLTRFATVL